MQHKEIFISYRRSDSLKIAEKLYEQLTKYGKTVFWDKETLESGDFSDDIKSAIKHCENFVLIINHDTLTRCKNNDDWLRKEVLEALKNKKNIVPLFIKNNYEFPKDLPKEMYPLKTINGIPNFEVNNIEHINILLTKHLNAVPIISNRNEFKIKNGELLLYKGKATIIEIPSGIKKIGNKAFYDMTKISQVRFNKELIEIGDNAFERCLQIETLEFPSALEKIGNSSFLRCSNLKSIKFNENLKSIGNEAFKDCSAIKSVKLNKNIEKLGEHIFCNCILLTEIDVPSKNEYYDAVNGVLYTKNKKTLVYAPIKNSLDKLVISDKTKYIGKYAFYKNECKVVEFKGKIDIIDDYAFASSKIKKIICVNDEPENLSENAFMGNENINAKWNKKRKKQKIEANKDNVKNDLILFKYIVVTTTFESENDANMMASLLLEKRIIVAAQVRKIRSLYVWEGNVCNEPEYELQVFSEGKFYDVLEKTIKENHPYNVPQIVCVPMINTTIEWGKWLSDYVGG